MDTIGLYDPATGSYFLRNANTAGAADVTLSFGAGGASILPIVGDWDGDGDDTVGIYASNSGTFFLRNSNTPGGADIVVSFGAAGSMPLVGDWDGNGSDTIGIYAPASGSWFMRNANTAGGADYSFTYGAPNSMPIVGDWDNTSIGVPAWMRTYSYDDAGNRLSATRSETGYSVSTTYNSTNQIVSQTGSEPLSATYDANGNLRTVGTRTYFWDAQNRLTGFADSSNGRRGEFKYDGYGRRTRIIDKSNSVVVNDRTYIWSRTQIVEERDTATNVTLRRYYGAGFTEGASNTKYFYVSDHLRSVRALTDSVGSVVTRIDYDPFGRRTSLAGSLSPTFGYAGSFTHGWSQLNLTMLRVRDTDSGHWLSRDPIGEADGYNLYSYVRNRPVSYIDPLGDDSLSVTTGASVGGGAGIVGAGATGSVKVGYDWTRDEWGGNGTGGGYIGGPYGDYDPAADPKWYQGFGFGGWAGTGVGLNWSDADGFMSEAGVSNGVRFYAGFVSAELAEDASGNESWTVMLGPGLPSYGFEWFTTRTGNCFVDKHYEWDKEHNPRHRKNPFWW